VYCHVFAMYVKFNSAKSVREQAVAHSNQVIVEHSGWCEWRPVIVWSITHCPTDSTWFPFDEQQCHLIYESWKYDAHEVNVTSYFGDEANKAIQADDLQPNDLWEILGRPFYMGLCITFSVRHVGSKFHLLSITLYCT